ncbi:hypothetical protein DVH05_021046 [Phytophthora capsici]|nr:hypothetical protein DVH05_003847 [Phytophthora capsici]KAG1694540.1 hypothetical protein DVH05_021046 [Phytophthora capsici]
MLPASSIHNRWNMFAVLDIKEVLVSEADTLQSIVRMAQLMSPKLKLPNGTEEGIREPGFKGPKQVAYVHLRRNERADQVVLSSGEKYSYAKAMLKPLLQHLSDLSSSEFYTELNAWKEAVDNGLRRSGSKARTPATSDDKDEIEEVNAEAIGEVDIFSVFDAIETADLMNAMDEESPEDSTYDDSDNDSVPPTQPAEEELLQPLPLRHGVSIARDDSNHDVSASSAPTASIPVSTSISVRQVDVINVPKPKGRGRPRPSPKRFQ